MVLMRLFQTSRRFQVEIQPQLVLLQKTLLDIEGLGRQLDPDLDLWSTGQAVFGKVDARTRWGHSACGASSKRKRRATPRSCPICPGCSATTCSTRMRGKQQLTQALLQEQRRTNRLLQSVLYAGLGFVLGLIVARPCVRFQLF